MSLPLRLQSLATELVFWPSLSLVPDSTFSQAIAVFLLFFGRKELVPHSSRIVGIFA